MDRLVKILKKKSTDDNLLIRFLTFEKAVFSNDDIVFKTFDLKVGFKLSQPPSRYVMG